MEIVELLLAAGADPSLEEQSGSTAADWAQKRGMRRVRRAAGPVQAALKGPPHSYRSQASYEPSVVG